MRAEQEIQVPNSGHGRALQEAEAPNGDHMHAEKQIEAPNSGHVRRLQDSVGHMAIERGLCV